MSRLVFMMIAAAMAVFPLAGTGSTDGMARTVSATISISLTIPPKNWRDTHRFVLADSTPAGLKYCLQTLSRKAVGSAKASNLVRTCTHDREYPIERIDNTLIVMVAGV